MSFLLFLEHQHFIRFSSHLCLRTHTFNWAGATTFYSSLGAGGLEAAWSCDPGLMEPVCLGPTLVDGMLWAPHGK